MRDPFSVEQRAFRSTTDIQFANSKVGADFFEQLIRKDKPFDVRSMKPFEPLMLIPPGDNVAFGPDCGFDDCLFVLPRHPRDKSAVDSPLGMNPPVPLLL